MPTLILLNSVIFVPAKVKESAFANTSADQQSLNQKMELNALTAISPVDGRYRKQVQHLDEYFSEYGLMKYRVQVEIEYLLFLKKKKFFKFPVRPSNIFKNLLKILDRKMPRK